MKLSRNFSLGELTKSQTALRMGIDNNPTPEDLYNLHLLCNNILQPLREHYGRPVTISSGYRSEDLCVAIGSSRKSQHAKGQAADFEVMGVDNKEVAEWIRDVLDFDQLILEFYKDGEPNSGWIHCSYAEDNRGSILRYDGTNYIEGLE